MFGVASWSFQVALCCPGLFQPVVACNAMFWIKSFICKFMKNELLVRLLQSVVSVITKSGSFFILKTDTCSVTK